MSYLVIARRFRPQSFGSIEGQEHISRALANAIARGRVAHAMLFTGPRGVGKTTAARVLAKALNCSGRPIVTTAGSVTDEQRQTVEPCGECSNCTEISKGSSLACREIDGASNNSVDNVRELIESLRTLPPPGSKYKIYLVDEVHMLSTAAFNALLKSLEEPPPNTIFIFATTDPQKIPETVISRCQRFDFRRLPKEVIISNLKKIVSSEKVTVDDEVFRLISKKAQGGMRDAQSLLDRLLAFSNDTITLEFAESVFGVVNSVALTDIVTAVLSGNAATALSILDQIFQRSLDLKGFVSDLITNFRALLLLRLGDSGQGLELEPDQLSQLKSIAVAHESFDLQRLFQLAQEIGDRALISNFPRYVIEAGVVRMADMPSLRPISELVAALSNGGPKSALDRTPKVAVSSSKNAVEGTEPAVATSFNPSWITFVKSVQTSGSPIVAQFLRRVTARRFLEGRLELEGTSFDIGALKDASTMEALKRALENYAPGEKWEVFLHEVATVSKEPGAKSLVAQEDDEKKLREEQVKKEVREDPLVKAALATFEGSAIEKIQALKAS